MVLNLQRRGLGRLADIKTHLDCSHYWYTSTDLGYTGEEVVRWNRYTALLYRNGIRLNSNADKLIWDHSPDGCPSAKSLYNQQISVLYSPTVFWWSKRLWKWRLPPKIKCFWWLAIQKHILTWDNLLRRGFSGSGYCVMCKEDTENTDHLFVHCNFTKRIWYLMGDDHSCAHDWGGLTLAENFEVWARCHPKFVHFPALVSWTIWRVRNNIIFYSHRPSVGTIIYWISRLCGYYPALETKIKKYVLTHNIPVSTILNIGTFDGAAQGGFCGGGGTLTFSDSKSYHFKVGLGEGTNTKAELLSLWALLWTAKHLQCEEIQIYGDSMAIIDLINGRTDLRNMALEHWYHRTLSLKNSFTNISLVHHYRDFNVTADKLSKEALTLEEGSLLLKEISISDTLWVPYRIYYM